LARERFLLSQAPILSNTHETKKSFTPFTMTRQEKKKIADPKIFTDAVHMAEEAGLRYVSHDQPGYTRKARGEAVDLRVSEGPFCGAAYHLMT
jgi:hypothetical protein